MPVPKTCAELRDSIDKTYGKLQAELDAAGRYEWAGKWPLIRWISVGTSTQFYPPASTCARL